MVNKEQETYEVNFDCSDCGDDGHCMMYGHPCSSMNCSEKETPNSKRTIKATFFGGCTVVIDDKIVMSHVGFEIATRHIKENGGKGTILQEFIDEDGWQGYYMFPTDLSDDT